MYSKNTQTTTLATAVFPPTTLWRDIILIVAGSLLIALSAQITLPMWPVPITGQTFGVLLIAALLGRRSTLSVILYLVQGALGLPFFAGGAAGVGQLIGPTGGYLLGFVAAAFVVGWLCELGWDHKVGTAVAAMLIGNVIIYFFGMVWLANFVGLNQVLQIGLLPFIPGDIIKIILAALVLPAGWQLLARR